MSEVKCDEGGAFNDPAIPVAIEKRNPMLAEPKAHRVDVVRIVLKLAAARSAVIVTPIRRE